MRSPDEIKKGLELCYEDINCSECPYVDDCFGDDETPFGVVMPDALALIQQLQAQNAEKDARIQQLEAERDAAVSFLKGQCHACKFSDCSFAEEPCASCFADRREKWQWRGVTKEE